MKTKIMKWAFSGILAAFSPALFSMQLGDPMLTTSEVMRNASASERAKPKQSRMTLNEIKGAKGILVVFICNHCSYVKAWKHRLLEIANAATQNGIGVAFVNSNDPADMSVDDFSHMKSEAQGKWHVPYLEDATSDIARKFGAEKTPEAFLFDAKNKLVYHGTIDNDPAEDKKPEERKNYLADAVQALSKGQKISVAESKAMGCRLEMRDAK